MRTKWLILTLSLLVGAQTAAQEIESGVNYHRLNTAQPVHTGDNIEVLELFWYRCPHCYRLEPYLKQWLKNKPEFVEFVRMPAILNQTWAFDARVYYTLVALDLVDKLHEPYFDAIHKERKRIVNVEQFANWAAEHGVDRNSVLDTFTSFGVDSMVSHALDMTPRYETDGVPTIIIDGKYRSKVSLAGGHNELIDLINHLATVASDERQQ